MRLINLAAAGSLLFNSEASFSAGDASLLARTAFTRGPEASELQSLKQGFPKKGGVALFGDIDRPLSHETVQTLEEFYARGGEMSLVWARFGESFERMYDGRSVRAFPLNLASFEAARFTTITVPGQVVAILVDLPEKVLSVDRVGGRINDRPLVSELTVVGGVSYAQIYDVRHIERVKVGDVVSRRLVLNPRLPLKDGFEDELKISLDLSPLGLGRAEDIFVAPRLGPIGNENRPLLFSDLSDGGTLAKISEVSPSIRRELGRFHSFIALDEPLVRKVFIPNAVFPNAFVQLNEPETIVVQDELLKFPPELFVSIRHEAWHSFDLKYNCSSGPEFRAAYEDVRNKYPGFLENLSEGRRHPDLRFAGHAGDNALEAFASFGNLLMDAESGSRLFGAQRCGSKERASLLQLVKGFEASIRRAGVPPHAPVFDALSRVRAAGCGDSRSD